MSNECPICKIQHPPKGPFRFRIMGKWWHKDSETELASAMRLPGAEELVESFKKWPAVDPKSLRIVDTQTDATKDHHQ